MSFMEGDLHVRCRALEAQLADMRQQRDGLVTVTRFMADRMQAIGFKAYGPACWGHIVRELRKLGVEVER